MGKKLKYGLLFVPFAVPFFASAQVVISPTVINNSDTTGSPFTASCPSGYESGAGSGHYLNFDDGLNVGNWRALDGDLGPGWCYPPPSGPFGFNNFSFPTSVSDETVNFVECDMDPGPSTSCPAPDIVNATCIAIGSASCSPSPPSGGIGDMIAFANSAYASTTGFTLTATAAFAGDTFFNLFAGSGLAVLYELRYWIVALLILAAIIYFSFRALRFFKH